MGTVPSQIRPNSDYDGDSITDLKKYALELQPNVLCLGSDRRSADGGGP
jgi:hypothetical protein